VIRALARAALVCVLAACAAPVDTAPRTAGGRVHAIGAASGATVTLEVADGGLAARDAELVRWTERAVAAIEAYYGRFPLPAVRVTVLPRDGTGVLFGQAGADGIRVLVGRATTRAELDRDWTLTHEMVHLALPCVPRAHHWLEEGTATYVEPIARALAGQRTVEDVWRELLRTYHLGNPRDGDGGLDGARGRDRTYYGGALWCLVADVELRKATGNRVGLRDALMHVLRAGGDTRQSWSLERVLEVADGAAGGRTLRELHALHANEPVRVDLDALWRELGVARRGRRIVFDDAAPLAHVRRAIVPAPGT
jgi:hypothetical protein